MHKSLLISLSLLVTVASAQLPTECECPLECVCSLADGLIDCTQLELRYVPVEINSCAWPGITKIDLSGNFIGLIHDYAFSQLAGIKQLYLDDNQIEQIGHNAFVGLETLEVLYLDGNRIASLDHRVFRSLKKLKRLLLYANLLTTLPYGIFSGQSALTQLALYGNRLGTLKTEIFDDVIALEELYLHGNQISDLSNAPFRSLVNLRTLYLDNNRLTTISRFSFLGLGRLNLLILKQNAITHIESDAFNPTQTLQHLYLENNKLTEVDRLMFAGLSKLLRLHLYDNEITRISDAAFYRLTKLRKLSIHSNVISKIGARTFVGLDSLEELVLNHNQLTSIANNTFAQLTKLENLWLYSNRISCLEPNSFNGLQNLQILQLAINEISYIPDDLFQNTPSLKYLFLYDNNIRSIGNTPFRNLQKLIQLSINYNSIEYIAPGALNGTDNLYYMQWSDFGSSNDLVCDCSALWLYEWMNSHSLQSSVICGKPLQHNGQDIRGLQKASFGCTGAVLSVEVGPDCDNHIVPQGGCLRLTCSSSPRGPVTWKRLNGAVIQPPPATCSGGTESQCGQRVRGEGVLLVSNVTPEDGGYYMCTAEFANVTRSQVCRVTIGEPPIIDRKPVDVLLASPGPAASFSLDYSGSPRPTVKWYFNTTSGSEILLNEEGTESRYLVSDQGTLVILQTALEDQGQYRAVVNNGAGETSVVANLLFYYDNTCRHTCLNGGRCVQLPVCSCSEDFVGRQCEEYIGITTTVSSETDHVTSTIDPISTTSQATPTTGYSDEYSSTLDDEDQTTDSSQETPTEVDKEYTDSPTIGTTEMDISGSGSGFDETFTDDENSNGTDSPDEEDTTGLVDDEDYTAKELGAVGSQDQRKRREAQDSSKRVMVRNKIREAVVQSSPNKRRKLGRKNRITRRELFNGEDVIRDSRDISNSLEFQEMIKQTIDEETAFEIKMDEAIALARGNKEIKSQTSVPRNSNFNTHKSVSLDGTSSKLGKHEVSNIHPDIDRKNVIPSKVRSEAVGEKRGHLQDVFGERINWEYQDDFDPDEHVPRHVPRSE